MSINETLLKAIKEYDEAKAIIKQALAEVVPTLPEEAVEHNARMILARLACKKLVVTKVEE